MSVKQPHPRRINRVTSRARIIYFVIPILVTVIILGIGQAISHDIADDNAMRMSRQYAIEAAANFQIYMNPHMRLMQQMTYSTAIARWLANENDAEIKAAAFEAMMGHAATLPNAYYLFTIEDSMRGYVFGTDITLDEFTTRGVLDRYDIESQWYFDAKYAQLPFVLNIQRSQPDEYGNWELYIWSNRRIYYEGRFVGVFTLGSPFSTVFDATFGGFDDGYKRGYVIDRYGMVRLDSAGILETTVEGLPVFPPVPEADNNPYLAYEIMSHLQELQGGEFPLGTPNRGAVRLTSADYRYASISPIVGTDWSVMVLSGTAVAFDARYMPLVVTAALLVVLLLVAGGFLIQRTVLQPIQLAMAKEQRAIKTQQLMYDSISIPSTLWDLSGKLIDCNEAMTAFFGLSSKQDTIERYYEFMPEYQACGNRAEDICKEELATLFDSGKSVRKRWLHKIDEEIVPVEVTMTRIPMGDTFVGVCYVVDLRPLEAAMEKEREAHEQAQLMLDNAPVAMTLFDKDLNTITCNREAWAMYGVPHELKYEEMASTMPPVQPDGRDSMEVFNEGTQAALSTGYFRAELMCQKQDGTPMPTDMTWAKVDYNGDTVVVEYAVDLTERKIAEEKERKSYEKIQQILDLSPTMINEWSKDLELIKTNKQAVEWYRVSNEQEYIDRFAELAPECQPCGTPTWQKAQTLVKEAFEKGSVTFEWITNTADGEPLPLWVKLVRSSDDENAIVYAYTSDLRDIKKLEAQLRENEINERTQMIIDSGPVAVATYDDAGELIDCNNELVKLFGFDDKEHFLEEATEKYFDFFPEYQPCGMATKDLVAASFSVVKEHGRDKLELMHRDINGNELPAEVNLVRIGYKDTFIVVAYVRDLREAKAHQENERKLREELVYREKLLTAGNQIARVLLTADNIDALMNGMNIIGTLIDLDRVGIWHHEEIDGELYFVKRHEWLSEIGKQKKKYAEGFAFPYSGSPEFFDILLKGIAINGPTSEQILSIQAHFNEYGVVSVAILPMLLDGELTGFLSLQDCVNVRTFSKDEMDIMTSVGLMYTSAFNRFKLQKEQYRIEVAEESNRAKTRFLARMSHEIRTPISAVLGISEIQLQNQNLQPETEESFAKIYDSSNLLLGIVNDILDLSKIEAGKMELQREEYQVASLISDAAVPHIAHLEHKNIAFKLHVDEALPALLIGDALRIKQIMNNILSNAFKYTESGSVELSLECEKSDGCAMLIITIRDTGMGMTSEQLGELFSDYTRFHEQESRSVAGTGLGMPIVYSLTQLMNAEIDVKSEVGKGTTVTVRIPQEVAGDRILGKEIAQSLQRLEMSAGFANKKFKFTPEPMPYGRVLVVDDVDANLYVAKGLLAFYSIDAETCESGHEAIEKIKRGNVYDIVFMDQMMPGINGTETMQKLRDMGYAGCIVALTANALIGQAEEFIKSGFDGFISKPIQTVQLNTLLQKFIRDKQPPDVIEKAKKSANQNNIDEYQSSADLQSRLRVDFARRHKNSIDEIRRLIGLGDTGTAHRLVHTLKGSAGLIYEPALAEIAGQIEDLMAGGKTPSEEQLTALESAAAQVLESIREPEQAESSTVLDKDRAMAVLDKLEPMLTAQNTESVYLVDELNAIPEAAVLVRLIEDFDFTNALKAMHVLRAILEER